LLLRDRGLPDGTMYPLWSRGGGGYSLSHCGNLAVIGVRVGVALPSAQCPRRGADPRWRDVLSDFGHRNCGYRRVWPVVETGAESVILLDLHRHYSYRRGTVMRDTAYKAVAVSAWERSFRMPGRPGFLAEHQEWPLQHHDVTPDRWDPEIYYDRIRKPLTSPTPRSAMGSRLEWIAEMAPADTAAASVRRMDLTQKLACRGTEALNDNGYLRVPWTPSGTAVILGNAMAGDNHLYSAARCSCEYAASCPRPRASARCLPTHARRTLPAAGSNRKTPA